MSNPLLQVTLESALCHLVDTNKVIRWEVDTDRVTLDLKTLIQKFDREGRLGLLEVSLWPTRRPNVRWNSENNWSPKCKGHQYFVYAYGFRLSFDVPVSTARNDEEVFFAALEQKKVARFHWICEKVEFRNPEDWLYWLGAWALWKFLRKTKQVPGVMSNTQANKWANERLREYQKEAK